MNFKVFNTSTIILILFLFSFRIILAQAVPVQLVTNKAGNWQLLRGGKPYYIKGAG